MSGLLLYFDVGTVTPTPDPEGPPVATQGTRLKRTPWPPDTVIGIYVRTDDSPAQRGGAPSLPLEQSVLATEGNTVVVDGLTPGETYWAVAKDPAQQWVYVAFTADEE